MNYTNRVCDGRVSGRLLLLDDGYEDADATVGIGEGEEQLERLRGK